MSSESEEANFRRLGLSIFTLEEKLEEIKTYSREMACGWFWNVIRHVYPILLIRFIAIYTDTNLR